MLSSCPSPFYFNQFSKSKTLAGKSSLPPRNLRFSRRLSTTSATASACAAAPRETAPPSLYDVLGIAIGATSDEIKAAYRRLARSCHPDVSSSAVASAGGGGGGGESESAGDEFIRVHAAYSTLSDPEKRANYDRALSRRIALPSTARPFPGLSVTPDSSSFCRVPRRNWETDQCW